MSTWFGMGALFGLLAMLLSLLVLGWNLYSLLPSLTPLSASSEPSEPLLTPIVPGVNLAMSQTPYLLISLLLSAIIHEIGHGVAALSVGEEVGAFGVFFLFVYPGAYVDVRSNLDALPAWRALKISSAGIWHNFALVTVAILLVRVGPFIYSPFYYKTDGVFVTGVFDVLLLLILY